MRCKHIVCTASFFALGILTIVLGALVCVFTRDIKPVEGEECSHLSMWKLLKDKKLLYMSMPAMFHGVIIKNFGYQPMFISWAVLSLLSILVFWRMGRPRTDA